MQRQITKATAIIENGDQHGEIRFISVDLNISLTGTPEEVDKKTAKFKRYLRKNMVIDFDVKDKDD